MPKMLSLTMVGLLYSFTGDSVTNIPKGGSIPSDGITESACFFIAFFIYFFYGLIEL
jgi:hypothetical protein